MKPIKEMINDKTVRVAVAALLGGLFFGWLFFGGNPPADSTHEQIASSAKETVWTCSMHPQIRKKEPGKCPLCGMTLIPLNTDTSEDNPMEIKMSPTAMQLANVQTSIVSRGRPVKLVRMNGKVQADERNVNSQTSHIAGRIEKLLVNYTGESISKGQVLAYIYSPELVTAQEELFEAYKTREIQPALYRAAREKLKNWKLTDKQIDSIIKVGQPQEDFPIMSDMTGVVLQKRINLGDHVREGSVLFEVADLTKIWVMFDVYESDIPWVKIGDDVTFIIQSLPGEKFHGTISFIDPVINPRTRVAKARVEFKNPGQRLKPEMFVVGTIKSPLSSGNKTIVVLKTAVMWTGERSVVYVKTASATGIGFMLREVTLGPALGDSYVIRDGLEEGEEIATNGTFSIDAAAQLAGKPSMMNPQGGPSSVGHQHGGMKMPGMSSGQKKAHTANIQLNPQAKQVVVVLLDKYFKIKGALAIDALDKTKKSAKDYLDYLGKINMSVFKGEAHNVWMKHSIPLKRAANNISKADDIKAARKHFIMLSSQSIMVAKTFGPFKKPVFVQFCPMANDNKGADWLSREKKISNPYLGQSMPTCGEVKKTIK